MMNEWENSMGWNFLFCVYVWYCENGNFNLINANFCMANNFSGYSKEGCACNSGQNVCICNLK